MKIECCGLTATQTKQIIDKTYADQVETLADADMVAGIGGNAIQRLAAIAFAAVFTGDIQAQLGAVVKGVKIEEINRTDT